MKKNSKGFMLIDTLIVSITVSAILIYLYFQFVIVNDSYTKSFRYNTVNGLYNTYDIKENMVTNGKTKIYDDVLTNKFVDLTDCDGIYYNNTSYCETLNEALNVKKVLITKGNLADIKNLMSQSGNINIYDETLRDLINKTPNSNTNYQIFVEFEDDSAAVVTYGTIFKVGDYVKMIPEKESYETDSDMTGYNSIQEINPSELNLWRVIRVNKDDTIEMVSEYVSSIDVYFSNATGYKNIVGYLNTLASQYGNSKFTIGARHIGYNSQTKYILDTSTFDGTSTNVPWGCDTGESCNPNEAKGGGDLLFQTDVDLVTYAYGGVAGTALKAKRVGTDNYANYWIASRRYMQNSNNFHMLCRYYDEDDLEVTNCGLIGYNDNDWYYVNSSYALRPIVILKSGIKPLSGDGTSQSPWVLE